MDLKNIYNWLYLDASHVITGSQSEFDGYRLVVEKNYIYIILFPKLYKGTHAYSWKCINTNVIVIDAIFWFWITDLQQYSSCMWQTLNI